MVIWGELDTATVPTFQTALDTLRSSGTVHVVVDLSEVGFIDSTALHAFVGLERPHGVTASTPRSCVARRRFSSCSTLSG